MLSLALGACASESADSSRRTGGGAGIGGNGLDDDQGRYSRASKNAHAMRAPSSYWAPPA